MMPYVASSVDVDAMVIDINSQLSPYTVQLQETSSTRISFLDVSLIKADRRIVYEPVLRDKGFFLSSSSSHDVSTHVSWPLAYVRRLFHRSFSIESFRLSRQAFLDRLRMQSFPSALLEFILARSDFFLPHHHACTYKRSFRPELELRVTLPYHPLLKSSGLQRQIREFGNSRSSKLCRIFGVDSVSISVAWRLTGKTFVNTVSSA